jgi:formylglycine-generating enzyme
VRHATRVTVATLVAAMVCAGAIARGDIVMDTVLVGNAGNAPDSRTGLGAVDYAYRIGTYEVTNSQYAAFLNAKASVGDSYGLYSPLMASTFGGIVRTGKGTAVNPYSYSIKNGDNGWADRPVNFVTYYDSIRFVNWLHNGQGQGDTETGAYTIAGGTMIPTNGWQITRNADATWWIPNADEWYKAAYHQNDGVTGNYYRYPTASDSKPGNALLPVDSGNNATFIHMGLTVGHPYYLTEVGAFENSASAYGTFDQGGNVIEWTEDFMGIPGLRGLRGGAWIFDVSSLSSTFQLAADGSFFAHFGGFRVAAVPEPGTFGLAAISLLATVLVWRRRFRPVVR